MEDGLRHLGCDGGRDPRNSNETNGRRPCAKALSVLKQNGSFKARAYYSENTGHQLD